VALLLPVVLITIPVVFQILVISPVLLTSNLRTATFSAGLPLALTHATPSIQLATAGVNGVLSIIDAETSPNTLLTLIDNGSTGSLSITGDINAGGNIKTGGITRLDNAGNLSNIGTIASGAITTTGTLIISGPRLISKHQTSSNQDLTLIADGTENQLR